MRPRLTFAVALAAAAWVTSSCSDQSTALTVGPSFARPKPAPECDPKKPEECQAVGRMTGGGGQVTIGDVYVTRGFTVHCDIVLSNNLEINWPDNKWHLDKPLTSATCIDDPAISPEPPPAPFDTFIGVGVGRLNNVDGYRVEFTFVDSGEPGGNNDLAQIVIFAPDNSVVLNVPMDFLDNGNLQAHYDQPHGSHP